MRPLGVLLCVCGVLGHLAPVRQCARSVCCVVCAASWATWPLFTDAPARCVVLCVRCPGPRGSCSPVRPLGVLLCVCGVLGHLAPVHRCARSVCCIVCALSWATWLLFTGVPARWVVLRVRCPWPRGSRSPVCACGLLCCVCGVLGHLAPVQRCARSVCCVVCAMSWATWLLLTSVPAGCVLLRVRCPVPLGSCSPMCTFHPLLCLCRVLGHVAPVQRCSSLVRCFAFAASWATCLPFTSVPGQCVALRVRCPGPLGSCSLVGPLRVLLCVCVVLGHLAPVHRCACSVCCVVCAVSWATWLLFTGVSARCVVWHVQCPGPRGSCSPMRPLGVLCCVCGVLGHLAPDTNAPTRCVVLRVRCPGPLGSCSPMRPLGVLCGVCAVLGHVAPVHLCARSVCCVVYALSWATGLLFTDAPAQCLVWHVRCPGPRCSWSPVARSVCCFVCAVSWATWLPFTGAPAGCVVWCVRCPGPPGSCSPVRPLVVLLCVCGVLGHVAPVHLCARSVCCVVYALSWATGLLFTDAPAQCLVWHVRCPGPRCSWSPVARSVCCFVCAVSWATWLPFTGAPAGCVVWCVRCPGPPGSCSPVRPLVVLLCVCGVLVHLAPVHRCARSVCCFACALSLATWLLFTDAPARCVLLCVRCPGPLGSCSPMRPLGVLCGMCSVLGHIAPVDRCARSVCCFACAVSWTTWLLFTGGPAPCVALRVRCPRPLGSCSPMRPLGVLCCVCGVLGHLAPVHRCVRSMCCVACAVSWATWLLFTDAPARCVVVVCVVSWATWLLFTNAPARCVVWRVRCPGPPGSCSPVRPLGVLLCVCGVLGHLAPVHGCARSVCCVVCAVSSATWLLIPMRPLGVLCCVCCVLGHLAPVHQCARSVCCVACAVSSATWLLFIGAPARCVVLCKRCPGPRGSCSPVRPLGVLLCVCGVLGHLAPVHRCARSVCCVACAVSWATWLLFTDAPARCVVLCVRCPGPLGSCSPMRPLGVLCCVCGVLGHLAPVHRCARSVCCVACPCPGTHRSC